EEVEVHRRADRVRPEAGRERHDGRGDLPQDGDQPSHLLRLAQEVWWAGGGRVAPTSPARGGEPQTQAVGGRPEPGQGHVAGCPIKKALRPAQRKTLVGHLIDRWKMNLTPFSGGRGDPRRPGA